MSTRFTTLIKWPSTVKPLHMEQLQGHAVTVLKKSCVHIDENSLAIYYSRPTEIDNEIIQQEISVECPYCEVIISV